MEIIEDSFTTLAKGIDQLDEFGDQEFLKMFNGMRKSYKEISLRIIKIKEKMIFMGYSKASTNSQGFFRMWEDFLEAFSVCKAWNQDKQLEAARQKQEIIKNMKGSIINQILSSEDK